VDGGGDFCPDWPRSTSIYQSQVIGGAAGGSSGSPVLNAEGQILGQMRGHCGDDPENDCDYANLIVDGSLNNYWSQVESYLNPDQSNPADLSITRLDATDGSYAPGAEIVVRNTTENIGGEASAAYRITFYASSNDTISTADVQLGYVDRSVLAPAEVHDFNTTLTIPSSGLAQGSYYIGAIITISDANADNNIRLDPVPITISDGSSFQINHGLNGAWFNPSTNGQGFFIDVLPDSGIVFISWFTFDTSRPASGTPSTLGESGHRWLTAQGGFSGNRAELDIYLTQGGVFNQSEPAPATTAYGSLILEFFGCNSGRITFTIAGIASNTVIPIERVATDNVDVCQSASQVVLNAEARAGVDTPIARETPVD
jgi:hypothetical protein